MQQNDPQAEDSQLGEPKLLDPAEFTARLEDCYQRLWVIAAAILGDRHMAEDVVQEAAVVAWRRIDQFQPDTNFAAWMSQIVRLQAFNSSRKRSRRNTHHVDSETIDMLTTATPAVEMPTLDSALSSDQTLFDDAVVEALRSVDEIPRACLLLKVIQQLNYREIAELLDIAEGTAMSHVHRTKTKLRKQLASHPE